MSSLLGEVAVIKASSAGHCTYCHRQFGAIVSFYGKRIFLGEEADHVLPRAIGGKVTVPACSLCNRVKGSLVFESLADIQDYLLERLVRGGSMMLEGAKSVKTEVAVQREFVSQDDLEEYRRGATHDEALEDVPLSRPLETQRDDALERRIARRTLELERRTAAEQVRSRRPLTSRRAKPDAYGLKDLPPPARSE